MAVAGEEGVIRAGERGVIRAGAPAPPTTAKIVVAGGHAAGKTTFIRSISDIEPLSTEVTLTECPTGDDNAGPRTGGQTTTTVALDFGRVDQPGNLRLYLFGVPGHARFALMWEELVRGAAGAVVLVDTRHLADGFATAEFFAARAIPFVVAINCVHGIVGYTTDELRRTLAVPAEVPVVYTDARSRPASRQVLAALVRTAMAPGPPPSPRLAGGHR